MLKSLFWCISRIRIEREKNGKKSPKKTNSRTRVIIVNERFFEKSTGKGDEEVKWRVNRAHVWTFCTHRRNFWHAQEHRPSSSRPQHCCYDNPIMSAIFPFQSTILKFSCKFHFISIFLWLCTFCCMKKWKKCKLWFFLHIRNLHRDICCRVAVESMTNCSRFNKTIVNQLQFYGRIFFFVPHFQFTQIIFHRDEVESCGDQSWNMLNYYTHI